MPLPKRYTQKKYPLFEMAGTGLVLIMLIVQLTRPYIGYDWFLDTIWLLSAASLFTLEWTKEIPAPKLPVWVRAENTFLLLCVFLFLYHTLEFILTVRYGDFSIVLNLAASVAYGVALYYRMMEAGMDVRKFQWKKLIQSPAWPVTVSLVLGFLALFFHMTKMARLNSYYGLQFGYTYSEGWGYNTWGSNFYLSRMLVKGFSASFGEAAGLLFLMLTVLHIVQVAGEKKYSKQELVFKTAVPVLWLWWIFGAKGYEALAGFGTILFILVMLLFTMAVYFPAKLEELISRIPKRDAKPPVEPPAEPPVQPPVS